MCEHKNFFAKVDVTRLTESDESDVVTGYTADIRIKCDECGLPFQFIGLPGGYSPAQPMCSFDAQEMRAPIKPSTDPVDQTNAILKQSKS